MEAIIPASPSAIYISHGGGPLPVLGDPGHREMVEHLRDVARTIRRPSAIVVVSAHWEENVATVTAHPKPPVIHDYYGFPPEAYTIDYPAPGDPALAGAVVDALTQTGVAARPDHTRGFDHGLYIPLLLMYPQADIPCVQLSLINGLDPEQHIHVGAALAGLADDNVLVLGSGFSFHNLRALLGREAPKHDHDNQAFERWLVETCTGDALDEGERARRLIDWEHAPGARYCHPREEHLLPLHVCYGVTGRAATAHVQVTIMGKLSSTFFW